MWQIWAGNPAKFLRKLTGKESAFISTSASNYAALAQTHLAENSKDWEQVVEEKVTVPPLPAASRPQMPVDVRLARCLGFPAAYVSVLLCIPRSTCPKAAALRTRNTSRRRLFISQPKRVTTETSIKKDWYKGSTTAAADSQASTALSRVELRVFGCAQKMRKLAAYRSHDYDSHLGVHRPDNAQLPS